MSLAEPAQDVAAPIGAATDRRTAGRLLLLLASLLVGGAGIWLLREPWAKKVFWPWLVLLASMLMAAVSLRDLELWLPGAPLLPRLAQFSQGRRRVAGLACIAASVLITAGVVIRLWPDYHNWHGTPLFWIVALILMAVGAWLLGAVGHGAPRAATASTLWSDSPRNRRLELLAFALIFILAVFLRTYRLDSIPSGIYVDETNGSLDALYINEGRDVSPFATGWYGTPNGYLYYMAGVFRVFGANWYSLKFVSLLPAILTIPAVYLLGRALFGPLAGLAAMLFMAVSRWHLSMSRWGWNETAPPMFQVLSFYFLIRGLRERRAFDYALSGLLMGLSIYTYLSARLAVATALIYIIYWFLSDPSGLRASLRRSWLGLGLLAIAALVAVAPIGVTYVRDPFAMNNRVSEISIFRDVKDQGSYAPLVANFTDILKFFHQTGDLQGKHNLPGEPMADPFTGLLFAIGVAFALFNLRDQRRGLLLIWLVLGLAGSFLSSHHESPQSYRSLTALPAVVLLAADVLDRVARAAYRWLSEQRSVLLRPAFASLGAGGLVMAALAGAAIWESTLYFGAQAHSIAVIAGFNPTENGVAHETIAALQAGETVYLSPNFSGFSPLRFLLYGVYKAEYGRNTLDDRPYNVVVPEVNLPVPDGGQDVLMLLDSSYWPIRSFISSLYPNADMQLVSLSDGSPIYMRVQVPRSDVEARQGVNRDATFADGHDDRAIVPDLGMSALDSKITQVTWSGAIRLEHGGQYEFRVPDGMQLSIGGQPIQGTQYLGRGMYSLRLVSNGPPAPGTGVLWKTGNTDFAPIPPGALFHLADEEHGLLAAYWNNPDWSGAPMFRQVTPFLMLAWPDEQPIVPTGPFSARFTGTLHVTEAGTYQFRIEADDGARLILDGKTLGDGTNVGHPNNFDVSVPLPAGDHTLEVDYVQQGGGSALRFYWRTPEQDWSPVPPDVLTPAQP